MEAGVAVKLLPFQVVPERVNEVAFRKSVVFPKPSTVTSCANDSLLGFALVVFFELVTLRPVIVIHT